MAIDDLRGNFSYILRETRYSLIACLIEDEAKPIKTRVSPAEKVFESPTKTSAFGP